MEIYCIRNYILKNFKLVLDTAFVKIQENKRLMKIKGFTEFYIYNKRFFTSMYNTHVQKMDTSLQTACKN
jgi:hypothetical protein